MRERVTLSLPGETLCKVNVLAAKRGTPVSAMLRERLEALVHDESDYERLWREFMGVTNRGFDLGIRSQATWTRDELHER